jgi:hypothetical protein
MKTLQNISLLLTATGLVFACAGENQAPVPNTPVGETTVTSQNTADKTVVNRLATARCDQEQGCNNVGPGAKFASRDVCLDQIRGSIGNDLNAYKCPRGLDSDAIDRCMMAIKSEECSHPFDTLQRFDKCRSGAICIK